jgi:hypothetical protein
MAATTERIPPGMAVLTRSRTAAAAVASDGERSSIVRTMGPSARSTVCLMLLSYIVRLAFGHGTSDESSPAFRK